MLKEKNAHNILWTKYYVLMILMGLVASIGHSMLMATLPLFAISIGGNNSIAGTLVMIFSISALLFRPFFGGLMDKKSRKLVLMIGLVIYVITALAYNLAYTIPLLLFLRLINGIGFSAQTTSSGTIVADIVPPARLSEGIGYFGMAQVIASAIGPVLGLFLVKNYGFHVHFIVLLVFWGMSLLVSFFINYEQGKKKHMMGTQPPPKIKLEGQKKRNGFPIEKATLSMAIVTFFIAFGNSSVLAFMPTYGAARGLDGIGFFFTVYAITILFVRLITGKLADRYGFTIVLIPSMLLLIVSLVMIAFASSIQLVLIAAVFYGMGFGTIIPITNALIIKLSSPEKKGMGNATYYSSMDIGIGIGAFVWGVIAEAVGFTAVFLGATGCIAISVILYFAIVSRKVHKLHEEPLIP